MAPRVVKTVWLRQRSAGLRHFTAMERKDLPAGLWTIKKHP
jgi:hypothetical protein